MSSGQRRTHWSWPSQARYCPSGTRPEFTVAPRASSPQLKSERAASTSWSSGKVPARAESQHRSGPPGLPAGFTGGEAEELRRALAVGPNPFVEKAMVRVLEAGAAATGSGPG